MPRIASRMPDPSAAVSDQFYKLLACRIPWWQGKTGNFADSADSCEDLFRRHVRIHGFAEGFPKQARIELFRPRREFFRRFRPEQGMAKSIRASRRFDFAF
jgi:hypothetical protein